MALMETQLRALELDYERVDAIDASLVTDAFIDEYWRSGATTVSRGAKCCFMSHRKAWEALLATDRNWAAIVEDDVRFHADASYFLSNDDWLPPDAELVK